MKNNKPRSKAFGISLATGIIHILSALTAIVFFILLRFVPLNADSIGTAIALVLILPLVIILLIIVILPQLCFGIGITVSAVCGKKKLCAIFCGVPMLADLIAVIFSFVLGIGIMTDLNIVLTIVIILFGVMSLACIILSIIAMVKNISQKTDLVAQ
ncbi:MAG: hypothetical protein J1F61_06030 [Clostridiales bacterium]|nr:hypothetical protein [Clostridiales bacterium]